MASASFHSVCVATFSARKTGSAIFAGLVAIFASTAEAQLRTEFDGRVRPPKVSLRCEITLDERDIKRVRSDANGNFVLVMENVGEWIRHGYSEVQSSRDGNRIVKSYARDFKLRIRVDAAIINLDAKPLSRQAAITYQWQQPRYEIDTLPAAMKSYAASDTKNRMQQRSAAIIQGWKNELNAVGRALNSMSFQYNANELGQIRTTRQGSLSRNARIRFCEINHALSLDVRWRSFVPGEIGGEGRP